MISLGLMALSALEMKKFSSDGVHENYDQTLNHPSGTVCPMLDATFSVATPDIDIRTDEPTLDEVVRAVKSRSWL